MTVPPEEPSTTLTDSTAFDPRAVQRREVDLHRGIAVRLTAQGQVARAFTEFVRATREAPMSVPLAAALSRYALAAGTTAAAITLLAQSLDEVDRAERGSVLRLLARLHRRNGDVGQAIEVLAQALAERPADPAARGVFQALLREQHRWDELDASLEKEVKEALKAQVLRRAARAALARAKLWAEVHRDPARAALRLNQAAQITESMSDLRGALLLRLMWLKALHEAQTPEASLREAVSVAEALAARLGQEAQVGALLRELEEAAPRQGAGDVQTLEVRFHVLSPDTRATRRTTQLDVSAVAEALQAPAVVKVAAATEAEGFDGEAAERVELLLRRAADTRGLVALFEQAAMASQGEAQAGWLAKLAKAPGPRAAAQEALNRIVHLTASPAAQKILDQWSEVTPVLAEALAPQAHEVADGEAALALLPANPDALAELDAGRGEREREALQMVSARTSELGEVKRLEARLREGVASGGDVARASYQQLLALLDAEGRAADATELLEQAVAADPDDAELSTELGVRLLRGGHRQRAFALIDRGARLSSPDASHREKKGPARSSPRPVRASAPVPRPSSSAGRGPEPRWNDISNALIPPPLPPRKPPPPVPDDALPAFVSQGVADAPEHHVVTGELDVERSAPAGRDMKRLLAREREALFHHVREHPLESDGYKALAEHFDLASDPDRSTLMLEVARALEGDPHAAPKAPRLILTAADRAGLKHPSLRGEVADFLTLGAPALLRLFPSVKAKPGPELRLDSGKGAPAVADALLVAVRVLGLRAPAVSLSDEAGPPFSLEGGIEPSVVVAPGVVKRPANEAELRFFAGRALFTLTPELLVLRSLKRDQLLHGLALLVQAAQGKLGGVDGKIVRDATSPRSWERLKPLALKIGADVDVIHLSEGARHSANRAGLVVAGGVAPAMVALQQKRALPLERAELVRFAASERYLGLRERSSRAPMGR